MRYVGTETPRFVHYILRRESESEVVTECGEHLSGPTYPELPDATRCCLKCKWARADREHLERLKKD